MFYKHIKVSLASYLNPTVGKENAVAAGGLVPEEITFSHYVAPQSYFSLSPVTRLLCVEVHAGIVVLHVVGVRVLRRMGRLGPVGGGGLVVAGRRGVGRRRAVSHGGDAHGE